MSLSAQKPEFNQFKRKLKEKSITLIFLTTISSNVVLFKDNLSIMKILVGQAQMKKKKNKEKTLSRHRVIAREKCKILKSINSQTINKRDLLQKNFHSQIMKAILKKETSKNSTKINSFVKQVKKINLP